MAQVGSCLLSPQRTRFDPRPVCGNLLWTVLHLDGFLSEFLGFPLSLSFHHASIFIFMYTFLFPEGQMEEAWKNVVTWS